jgi:uncharacterized protein YjbI with pentapeptide repeats
MADEKQVALLRQGVAQWNAWRQQNRILINLAGSNLRGADLSEADLSGADLSRADLSGADLRRSDLSGADLSRATLWWTNLSGTDLGRPGFGKIDLSKVENRWDKHSVARRDDPQRLQRGEFTRSTFV